MYQPQPLNTEGIELEQELLELTEKIAENVHDVTDSQEVSLCQDQTKDFKDDQQDDQDQDHNVFL